MTDDARTKRLKAALRDNLHRRKAQIRGRTDDAARAAERSDATVQSDGVADGPKRRDG